MPSLSREVRLKHYIHVIKDDLRANVFGEIKHGVGQALGLTGLDERTSPL